MVVAVDKAFAKDSNEESSFDPLNASISSFEMESVDVMSFAGLSKAPDASNWYGTETNDQVSVSNDSSSKTHLSCAQMKPPGCTSMCDTIAFIKPTHDLEDGEETTTDHGTESVAALVFQQFVGESLGDPSAGMQDKQETGIKRMSVRRKKLQAYLMTWI